MKTIDSSIKTAACAFLALITMPHLATAGLNDVYPGDYFAPQLGSTSATLYGYQRDNEGYYAQGQKAADGQLESQIVALRLTHAVRINDMVATPIAVFSWAHSEIASAPLGAAFGKQAEGLGDMRLGVTVWPVNNPQQPNYLGLTALLTLPTGDYNNQQILNMGENRWRFTLSAGWQKDIHPKLLFELSPEIAFYGDNSDYNRGRRLAQDSSYALTGYLRWRAIPLWHPYLGAEINRGGATWVDGLAQNNPSNKERIMAGASFFLPEQQQLIVRLSKDTHIDNGFRTKREIALRYMKRF